MVGIPVCCLQAPATGGVEIGHENGLHRNEFNESSFSPALPALIPIPTVNFQPAFWQGHCSVTAGWSCTWIAAARMAPGAVCSPLPPPQHIPGAALHRCPGTLRERHFPLQRWRGQCCCDSSWRFAPDRAGSPGAHGKTPSPEHPWMCPDLLEPWGS